MSKELRLPDGSYTKDASRFSEEWDRFRKPFEAMGFRVVGFDPHIALCDAETGQGHFQLPLYAAKKFIACHAVPPPNVAPGTLVNHASQETVTLVTIDLLQEAAHYLRRLPVVPVTHALIAKIDAHLADPGVKAARREAGAAEVISSRRTGGDFSPSGQPSISVVVEGSEATITVHKLDDPVPGFQEMRLERLAGGITLPLRRSQENARTRL